MAVASAPLGSQTLEPHYLLGHGGHCPRSKPAHGKLSPSQVLTGLEGARPGQRRLPQPTWGRPARLDLPAEAAGEGLFSCCTIPGYTGFVPRAQNHFAKTHSQICREAGQEFARLQGRAAAGSLPCQGPLSPQDVQPVFEPFHAKETPQPAASPPQAPSCDFQSPGAPAAVEDGAPQKYFVPGFTGFVPRARYLIGASYPTLTNQAWAEFRQMHWRQQQKNSLQHGAHRTHQGQAFPPLAKTYPTDKGLLPHYQGYVPGYKFRFGRTYGHLTYDALGRSKPEKLTLDRLP
ncbi:ciliary microtubule inner protein 2B isoform X1 [Paroedura picta]|uniref:ciliary microtubule inner protein 2B isoform X1 n=1 Tax=Paroedura picta TaxID=143630 RepID=UPI0010143CD5